MTVHLAADPMQLKPRVMALARVSSASARLDTEKAGGS